MITLKIKRIKRVFNRPPNAIQSLPELADLGKRPVGDLCIGSYSISIWSVAQSADRHVFRFGEEVQTFEQYSSTWSVVPYDQDVPGATKPSTYVSFIFRYRSPGISIRKSVVLIPGVTVCRFFGGSRNFCWEGAYSQESFHSSNG